MAERKLVFTLARLAVKFNVLPEGTGALPDEVPPLGEGEVDPLWDDIQELGMVLGAPSRGWYPIVCPNQDAHTPGPSATRGTDYKPSKGGGIFKCLHGHCSDLKTADLRAWIFRQRIPDLQAFGQRLDRLVAANQFTTNDPDHEGVRFREPPDAQVRADMLANYVHVEVQNKYWSVSSKGLVERAAIDDRMTAVMKRTSLLHVFNDHGTRLKDMAVSAWLRQQDDLPRVANITHRLGQPLIIDNCVNIAPPVPEPIEDRGDPVPWLELVDMVCQTSMAAEHWLDWCAMLVTDWTEKPGWVPMLKGPPGAGKGLMLNPIKRYLGEHHWIMIQPQELAGTFTYYAKSRLVILEELKQNTKGMITQHDIYNTIKKWTGRGNRMVSVRDLNKSPYAVLDLSGWVIFSNEFAPLPLEKGERRVAVFLTAPPKPEAWYLPIGKWIDGGGWKVVIGFLQQRWRDMTDAERESVRGNAPMTDAKQELIDVSGSGMLAGAIRLCLSGRHGEPWPDLMTMNDITQALSRSELLSLYDTHKNMGEMAVARALRNEGAVQLFESKKSKLVEYPAGCRMRLWCLRGDKAAEYEKLGQGRLMVDTYQAMKPNGAAPQMSNVVFIKPK